MTSKTPKFTVGQKVKANSMAMTLRGTIQQIDAKMATIMIRDGSLFTVPLKSISTIM